MTVAGQIKSRLDIVDVVGHYVKLKRQGTGPSYVGLCPFHAEKTPVPGGQSSLNWNAKQLSCGGGRK